MAEERQDWSANIGKPPEVGEFKGYPTITLYTEKGKPFRFGTAKARAVLDHIDAIRLFVNGPDF